MVLDEQGQSPWAFILGRLLVAFVVGSGLFVVGCASEQLSDAAFVDPPVVFYWLLRFWRGTDPGSAAAAVYDRARTLGGGLSIVASCSLVVIFNS